MVNDGLVPYGPFTTHQIAYTFNAGNGFTVGAAVEEGSDGEDFGTAINDYVPHVVVGVGYKTGSCGVSVVGGWDSDWEEFAVKGRVDVTPNDMFSFFVMGAWTMIDDGSCRGNYYAQWGGEWALGRRGGQRQRAHHAQRSNSATTSSATTRSTPTSTSLSCRASS